MRHNCISKIKDKRKIKSTGVISKRNAVISNGGIGSSGNPCPLVKNVPSNGSYKMNPKRPYNVV